MRLSDTCADLDVSDPSADMGLHDPRLYSNIRGVMAKETASERVSAHAYFSCESGMSISRAWHEGFYRGDREHGLPVPVLAILMVAGAISFPLVIRRWFKRNVQ